MKDPAALVYKDRFTASTNGMKGAFRAWYFDLLMYQFNNPEGIPNDEDEIAGICRVLPSEYDLFKDFLKQVLKQKFKQTESNLLINDVANDIIQGREKFIEKRSKSGKIGYLMKIFKAENLAEEFDYKEVIDFLMTVREEDLESMKDKQVFKQVLKQTLKQKGKLYINVNINKDKIKDEDKKGGMGEKKETKKKFIPPTENQVIEYFIENGFTESVAIKAYKYYSEANWKDSRGNQVKNWKQKMQGVWFKDENRIETKQTPQQNVSGRQDVNTMQKNLMTNMAAMDRLLEES